MSDVVTEQTESQNEAAALEAAIAGYKGAAARAEEAPADTTEEPAIEDATEPVAEAAPIVEDTTPPEPSIADELQDLKARVKALASTSDPDTVRKLHGEIGDINRTLKQLQAAQQSEAAPADDELAAAIKEAESVASEFPEVAGPLVKALKALSSKQPAQTAAAVEMPDIGSEVEKRLQDTLQKQAIEALAEEHPDYQTVRDTPEYKTWLASKPPEFQQKFTSTWNPAVVAKGLTEFKESLKAKQKKQTRLAAAVTPQGVPQKATPSTLPDEQGFFVGYNKGPKRLNHR